MVIGLNEHAIGRATGEVADAVLETETATQGLRIGLNDYDYVIFSPSP